MGNVPAVQTLRTWLNDWHPGKKNQLNAALVSGPPGVGKSTAAALVARQCGYELVEFNASDTRSKKLIADVVKEYTHSQSISSFFGAPARGNDSQMAQPFASQDGARPGFGASTQARSKPKKCLIMDEVDGMGAGDRGGIAELIKVIKGSQIPIICICNDRYHQKIKSLANHCKDVRFNRPTVPEIVRRIAGIAQQEGFAGDRTVLEKLIVSCNGDIRQILNTLQIWRGTTTDLRESNPTVQARLKVSKDIGVTLFDAIPVLYQPSIAVCSAGADCPRISNRAHCLQFTHKRRCPNGRRCREAGNPSHQAEFEHSRRLAEKMDMYFVDSGMVPLFVQDSYIRAPPPQGVAPGSSQHMDAVARAADAVSDGDLVDALLRSSQNYGLMTTHAVMSAVRPASFARGAPGASQFPAWFGKNSTTTKHQRLVTEVATSMRASSGGGAKEELRLHYLSGALRDRLCRPLIERGKDGIDDVIATMDAYGLSREDWQSVFDVSLILKNAPPVPDGRGGSRPRKNPLDDIPSQVKSAFTRTYNKHSARVKVAPQSGVGLKRGAEGSSAGAFGAGDEQAHDAGSGGEDEEEEDADKLEEAALAKLITEKKARKRPASGAASKPKKDTKRARH